MSPLDLRDEWADLLRRRPTFAHALTVGGDILEVWAGWSPEAVVPLGWTAAECVGRWERGVPLLAEAPRPVSRDGLEAVMGPVMEALAGLGVEHAAWLQRFAEAWDRGEVGVDSLLPGPGRLGSPAAGTVGLAAGLLGLLACASLRPVLDVYFGGTRAHLGQAWALGICPCCGSPPAWADLIEDGNRRLACHLCGAGWRFPRLGCPYCGDADAKDAVRLQAEGVDEGYAVTACARCKGYVKELDRRVRWNGGSALVEDWGSPHLDLVAARKGFWRGVPTLIQLPSADP